MDSFFPMEMLITFLEIIDQGSFNRAAIKVNRTQSAVSMQIKRLEEIAGKPLFQREGRGSRLTREGEILAGYARKIIRLNDEAYDQLTQPDLSGVVKVGIPDEFALRQLPQILAGFSRSYPLIQVDVTVLPSYDLASLLNKGKLDLILTFSSKNGPYKTILLSKEPTVWVGAKDHSVEERRPLPLALSPSGDCKFRGMAFDALDKAGIEYRISFASENTAGHIAAVSAGLAVSVLSRSIVPDNLKILLPCKEFPPLPSMEVYLVMDEGKSNPIMESLVNHFMDVFK
ncbi:MAG: LysR substrate-binding domain-containing protein [Spirochaetales bacterium]|nr:LysR substrate-binding domain-containing protein [Spirochaetales bacterium]